MTPDALADLHARCFTTPRPWTALEFAELLDRADIVLETAPGGFALAHDLGEDAEVLTIAVAPDQRRRGLGGRLIGRLETTLAGRGCRRLVLEVACDNIPAQRLYDRLGFAVMGRRPGYFCAPTGDRIDALVLAKTLRAHPDPLPTGTGPKIG